MKDFNLKIGIAAYGVVGKIRRKIIDNISGVKSVGISYKNPKYKILFFSCLNLVFNEVFHTSLTCFSEKFPIWRFLKRKSAITQPHSLDIHIR